MVLNAVTNGSATAGGGAYINAADSIGLYENVWSGCTAQTGSGAINFQTVQEGVIANDTYTGYDSCHYLNSNLIRSAISAGFR